MPLERIFLKLSVLLFGAARPTQPGEGFDVGGYNLYIGCDGAGSPTVILEWGLDSDVVPWRKVHPEVVKFTRVCRYERIGLAHSDYGPPPLDAEKICADLHTPPDGGRRGAALSNLPHEKQACLAKFSVAGEQIVIRDGGQNMPRENPETVIESIREIVSQQ